MRPILALVIALVASVVGHLVFWFAGASFLREMQVGFAVNPGWIALVVLGALIIAVAMLTVAMSPIGVLVVGGIQIVVSLLALLVPVGIDSFSPVAQVMFAVQDVNVELSHGMTYYVATGIALLIGVVFLVGGLVAGSRAVHAGATATLLGLIVAVVVGFLGLLVGIAGGYSAYRVAYMFFAGLDVPGVLLLLLGAILLGVAVATTRWSSLGVIVLGSLVALAALIEMLVGYVRALRAFPDLQQSLSGAAATGGLLLLGLLLIAAGVGLWLRGRRVARGALDTV